MTQKKSSTRKSRSLKTIDDQIRHVGGAFEQNFGHGWEGGGFSNVPIFRG